MRLTQGRAHPSQPDCRSDGGDRELWVSISGSAEVVDDSTRLRELWSTFAEAWLPEGPEDPNAILIHVEAETAQDWDNPGGRVPAQ